MLFAAHASDITRIFPSIQGAFVCPLCFRVFSADDLEELLDQEALTVGHVWPKEIRRENKVAPNQVVLLCAGCNSGTGGHGDAVFQDMHRTLEGQDAGELYGVRDVSVVIAPNARPIRLRARVTLPPSSEESHSAQLSLRKDHNDPAEWEKWRALTNGGQVIPAILVHPTVTPERALFAKAGMLTSAYLMAFYQLGYRYILNECLNPVRGYLAKTAKGIAEDASTLRDSGVSFFETSTMQPQLQLTHRVDRNTSCLRVAFRRYGVNLPVPARCHYSLLEFAQSVRDRMGSGDNEFFFDLSCVRPYGKCEQLPHLLGPTDYEVGIES